MIPTARKQRFRGAWLAGLVLLAAVGCVDPFVNRPCCAVERWTGVAAAAGPDSIGASCPAIVFDIFVDDRQIGGQAQPGESLPIAPITSVTAATWWVEGSTTPDGRFLFTLRRQGGWPDAPKPQSVWRGSFASSEPVAIEQAPSCERRLRLLKRAPVVAAETRR